jgi:hypothetical protein
MNYKNLKISDFEVIAVGEVFVTSKIELDNRNGLEIFVSKENETYSCLLATNNDYEKLPEINGLKISHQKFKKNGNDFSSFIVIECQNDGYINNFILILKEIIETYDNSNFEIDKAVNIVISKWRYFLAAPKSNILKEDEIVGLIGELLLLNKLIDKINVDAVDYWVANNGEEDFIFNSTIIEVKSTQKVKHEHIINGIDQLALNPLKQKFILSIIFNKSASNNCISLPSIINECSIKLTSFPDKQGSFYSILKNRGYDIRDEDQYFEFSYEYIRGGYFEVDESFPKLTQNELKSSLNSRLSKIRYTIDMEGLHSEDFNSTNLEIFL